MYIADLHIHSKYSRATSKELEPEPLDAWARRKGIGLVGTGEQIAEALLEYHKLGITAFLIRGFDPIQDALAYGREILPRVREAVAQRDEAFGVVTAEVA